MSKIFVSYRSDDCQAIALRIVESLRLSFGQDAISKDIEIPPLGVNIRKHVAASINPCDVLLVVIGKNWLQACEHGKSTLHDPWDLQRVAIELTLAAGIPVVPVYVDKAARGLGNELPSSLAELALRSGVLVEDGADFSVQMQELIKGVEPYVRQPAQEDAVTPEDKANSEAAARRLEELEQAEREIRQNTKNILLTRPAQVNTKGFHTLRDIPIAPELVIIPAGRFMMGSPQIEADRRENEGPQREVIIRRFAVGRFAVTFDEYDVYARAAGVDLPDDEGWGRGRRPVINVSWEDAQGYILWLNQEAHDELEGQYYRLLTEAEWEYACRAGTTTPFYTGETISTDQANFDGNFCYARSGKGRSLKATVKVGSYPPNPWRLYDMLGNTWEWVEDRFHDNYVGAPTNGTTWESGKNVNRVLRGGSWDSVPTSLRAACRNMSAEDDRCNFDSFRIARSL